MQNQTKREPQNNYLVFPESPRLSSASLCRNAKGIVGWEETVRIGGLNKISKEWCLDFLEVYFEYNKSGSGERKLTLFAFSND